VEQRYIAPAIQVNVESAPSSNYKVELVEITSQKVVFTQDTTTFPVTIAQFGDSNGGTFQARVKPLGDATHLPAPSTLAEPSIMKLTTVSNIKYQTRGLNDIRVSWTDDNLANVTYHLNLCASDSNQPVVPQINTRELHAILKTNDLDRMKEYYTTVTSFPLTPEDQPYIPSNTATSDKFLLPNPCAPPTDVKIIRPKDGNRDASYLTIQWQSTSPSFEVTILHAYSKTDPAIKTKVQREVTTTSLDGQLEIADLGQMLWATVVAKEPGKVPSSATTSNYLFVL